MGYEAAKPDYLNFRIPGTNYRVQLRPQAYIDPRQSVIAPYVKAEITWND